MLKKIWYVLQKDAGAGKEGYPHMYVGSKKKWTKKTNLYKNIMVLMFPYISYFVYFYFPDMMLMMMMLICHCVHHSPYTIYGANTDRNNSWSGIQPHYICTYIRETRKIYIQTINPCLFSHILKMKMSCCMYVCCLCLSNELQIAEREY